MHGEVNFSKAMPLGRADLGVCFDPLAVTVQCPFLSVVLGAPHLVYDLSSPRYLHLDQPLATPK